MPLPQGEALRQALVAVIPRLETERLILRAPELADWETLEPIWRTDRSAFIGGPFDEEEAWLDFANAVSGWLLRGVGYWTVARKSDGAVLGLFGLGIETTDPELELGWLLVAEAEGAGYALEAAAAVRAYAFDTLGLPSLISMIHRKNTRSIALAKRLGAVEDEGAVPAIYRDTDTAYRHTAPTSNRRNTDAIPTGQNDHD
ncbi:Acetyltransferase, GNAT family [Candidatus Rhodobacter oscarellae]|uniref:Acetyltransferase, GNAT family n=2 Tax=Candidatus Rhodobacter oscarellae TaxID=1675527 RepID=A0A0J9ECW6_9RHOB|nr:Acetyltransferase, GNAT family [Candidatus Rhodobacter lobularis]